MKIRYLLGICSLALMLGSCVSNKDILKGIEDSRSPDARRGVLGDSLNSEQRARLDLLGRTSAPSRYTERTDANRIRVVALDFGGVTLGQCADASGNLLSDSCTKSTETITYPDQVTSSRLQTVKDMIEETVRKISIETDDEKHAKLVKHLGGLHELEQNLKDEISKSVSASDKDKASKDKASKETKTSTPAQAGSTNIPVLHSGMFRQFSTRVGTTIEADISVGPVANKTRVYFSRNFLVLEWRRYYEKSLVLPERRGGKGRGAPYVSAIDMGIAVRIIFDVQLHTTDSEISASFGIANLSAALARNEATIEVSYEVTGTAIDPLPENAIIITSVNEYLEAFKRFHDAVSLISKAWESYATTTEREIEIPARDGRDAVPLILKDEHFSLAQLAYYVQGLGVGDNFALTKNADLCQDFQIVKDYLEEELMRKREEMDALDCTGSTQAKKAKSAKKKQELRKLGRELEVLTRRYEDITTRLAENACSRACKAERRRLEMVCDDDPYDNVKRVSNVMCGDRKEGSLLQRCADKARWDGKTKRFEVPTKSICGSGTPPEDEDEVKVKVKVAPTGDTPAAPTAAAKPDAAAATTGTDAAAPATPAPADATPAPAAGGDAVEATPTAEVGG